MGVADTTAPASFGTASDLRTAANPSAQHSADSPWLPLTTNARGIYFAAAIDPTNPCYNTAEVLQCPADTDLALLREAFEQLYRENEGFRVRTRIADGAASQQILPLEAFLEGIDLLVDGGELEEGELNGTAEAGRRTPLTCLTQPCLTLICPRRCAPGHSACSPSPLPPMRA